MRSANHWLDSLKEKDHSEGLDTDRKKRLKNYLEETRYGCVDYIHIAQKRDKWQALVNMIMKFHKRWRIS
jgi:hypothetical protein